MDAVAEERNRRTSEDFAAYARLLYDDAGIVATMIDSGLPRNDPLLDLIPGAKLRLFQLEPALDHLLQETDSYAELLRAFQERLERSVKTDGFVGVKVHLAEQVGCGSPRASPWHHFKTQASLDLNPDSLATSRTL